MEVKTRFYYRPTPDGPVKSSRSDDVDVMGGQHMTVLNWPVFVEPVSLAHPKRGQLASRGFFVCLFAGWF